ncbi:MAG: Transposase, IS4-like protein family protein [candidate division TM6 bacterium GW2011_GWE2_41_16]|nr:MAG: Transposase, IS4-like protein family protein [candidate division TM6 bacterium GW2011_GWE2_41_16]
MDISQKIVPEGWKVIPKRWAVERAFAWLNNSRRLSKDYETDPFSSENFVMISHSMTILARFKSS